MSARLVLVVAALLVGSSCASCLGVAGPGGDGGQLLDAGRCAGDGDCAADGGACQTSTGLCVPATCLTRGCDAGAYCDLATLTCSTATPGDHPVYVGETIAGTSVQQRLGARDAVGASALGEFWMLTATRGGRYLYILDDGVVRFDQSTGRVESFSGLGWPGRVDGPADVAQYEENFYQGGGIALSPDEKTLYFTDIHAVRTVDTGTGEGRTLALPELGTQTVRSLAVGPSGTLYLLTWGRFYTLQPGGTATEVVLSSTGVWNGSVGVPPGFMVVDEQRGVAYGLERNWKSGALYRWPLAGGTVEWLNHDATGTRDPVQYLSDGPVAGLEMANPSGLTIDAAGFVYMGAGDGRTFRRFNPESGLVESLCTEAGSDPASHRFEWCLGDGVRNKLFNTWPGFLTFDAAGNGYFGYTVWPRLVRLRRVP